MIDALYAFLTAGGAKWHESLPFFGAALFVIIDLVVRIVRGRKLFEPLWFGMMIAEGAAVTILPIYGFALFYSPGQLALEIAEKNGKTIASAVFVATLAVLAHLIEHWGPSDDETH